jgi:hypothetical protein
MLVDTTDAQAELVLAAMRDVASAHGTESLSEQDRRGIEAAWSAIFVKAGVPDLEGLGSVIPTDLAAALSDTQLRVVSLQVLAVMAFVDARLDDAKLQLVLDYADALELDADYVHGLRAILENNVKWAAQDMIRDNVASIPGMTWDPEHPYAPFLPYQGAGADPALTERYDGLADLAADSFGRAFHEHYRRNGFAFPGQPTAMTEVWATPHDSLHVLSGYSTSAQGELLVAAFTGAMMKGGPDMMESHVIPTILIYHMGISINKGLNKGDRDHLADDPSWRETFAGNVHLGLDPAKLWVAWDRGQAMTEDVYRPAPPWSFWDLTAVPVAELQERFAIAPLAAADAASTDDQIDRSAYLRPGEPLPELGHQRIADH